MADVSVIIDCYNHELFVEEAIASVLAQDWSGCSREIIVVDDGSTDATGKRALKYAPDVRYVYQKNQGQGQAFNAGFLQSSGEIICFLDGDDLWYPGKIAKVVRAFRDHPEAGFVQNPMERVDASGRPLRQARSLPPERIGLQDILDGKSVLIGTSGLSIRRSIFEKIFPVPKDLTTCADDYVSKHALLFASARSVPEILGGLRIHGKNSFQGMNWHPEKIESALKMQDRLDFYLESSLEKRGLRFSPEGRRARLLERKTKEILLWGWRGRRRMAFSAWIELKNEIPRSPFAFFKLMTLLIAAASPSAYLRLRGLYDASRWLPSARMALLKERAS